MSRPRGLLCILAALAIPSSSVAQSAADLLLVRCAEGSSLACLTATVDLDPASAGVLNRTAGAADTGWRVRFRRDTAAPGYGARAAVEQPRPARVLLLVDVSGSMRNLGIGVAKLVIKDNLLRPLDSLRTGAVGIAVAPFGSRDVQRRIASAAFVPPRQAVAQVEALPDPDRENTGLFSAVRFGVERLQAELTAVGGDATGLLIVLTDGDNDVGGPDDDPGLLDGAAGLQQAAQAVEQTRVIAAVVGVGSRVDLRPLRILAGSRGHATVVPLDAYQLGQPLIRARELLASGWEVTFRVSSGGREELGRGWGRAALGHVLGGVGAPISVWRPPVIALPAFSGVVTPGGLPAGLVEAARAGRILDRRIPLVLFLLILLALLWLVVPRLLWPPVVAPGAPAVPKKKPKVVDGLRSDVQEAAPRRPTDTTASKARATG